MKLLLDTNIIILLLNGDKRLAELLDGIEIHISVISEMETLSYPKLSVQEKKGIRNFFSECLIHELDKDVKELAIDLRARYQLKLPDTIIAATGIIKKLPFITSDKDFSRVMELDLISYEI